MNQIIPELVLNTDLARKLIVGFLHDEITRVGLSHAVIGLSGGIDSSLVAALAAEALGPGNVLGVMMPYKTSNPSSRHDAELMIEQLGIPHKLFEITPMVDAYFQLAGLDDASSADRDAAARRRGNIMARQRMVILFDQSAEVNGLVIGTANKTEALLGYTTQFGDAAAALLPIADLYKTQVRQLARAMNLPAAIIDKPPSADLWVGQTDEGELGFTYEQADQILYMLVDQRRRPEEVISLGYDERVVRAILRRIRGNQFKRVMPPVAKISARTIGLDFLYLRDWGV